MIIFKNLFNFISTSFSKKRMKKLMFLFLLFSFGNIYSFQLNVIVTNETCLGNGKLNFNVLNTDPNGSIVYLVYLLPDTVTPFITTSNSMVSGLSSGNYRIIARENVGTTFTTQQIDVSVLNQVTSLSYNITSFNQACSSTSTISVNVTSGSALSYEIFDGPITFPLQSSNVFSNLPIGVYKIRVFDTCGIGVVKTYTVFNNPTGLSISNPSLSNTTCISTNVSQTITPNNGTIIAYPLNIQYIIHPPNGASDIIINQSILSGDLFLLPITEVFPIYINQNYTYDLVVVDSCNLLTTNTFTINNNITLSVSINNLPCNEYYFNLNTTQFTEPYTLNFTTHPSTFDPILFNSNYPGPYTLSSTTFGNDTNVVPYGNYSVSITDSCGRTTNTSFVVLDEPPVPSVSGNNNGCLTSSGTITASIPNYNIVSAVIISAPISYPNSLPNNVSSLISNGVLTINPVPLGDYIIELVDDCTNTVLSVSVTVPVYLDKGLDSSNLPGCELGKGSLKLWSNNGKLINVKIVGAPSTYNFSLPNDVAISVVSSGILYLDDLPSGQYTFEAIDECNFTNVITVNIVGYAIATNSYFVTTNCGSFDVSLNFISNGIVGQSFWLQKLIDPSTNQWGNPLTGAIYANNTIPNFTNSIALNNLNTNYNFSFNGVFRIVRHFMSLQNGLNYNSGAVSSLDKSCIEILSPTFSFNESLEVLDFNRMPCNVNGNIDVIVKAIGSNPLHYSITNKNGIPFLLDNGNSNMFYNLPFATYTFQIEDICGNIVTRIVDIGSLSSLVLINKPSDILICSDLITNNETFDLSTQTPIIVGQLSNQSYTLSYYTSLAEAQNNINPIANTNNYNPQINPQTIFARLALNNMPECYEITSFELFVGKNPKLTLDDEYLFCNKSSVTINASGANLPNTVYTWSNGFIGQEITISTIGVTNLVVTASNNYGVQNLSCSTSKNISVVLSESPIIKQIETIDWTLDSNSITVITSSNGAYEYSLDGFNFQDNNSFQNLMPGLYTIYVKDKAGCGVTNKTVWLLYYLKYFTPNGDGYNDYWKIPFSENEKDLKVVVYDRYGKIITSFTSGGMGWDGTYSGNLMISDDYWFVVYRADGRLHKGHFCLKR